MSREIIKERERAFEYEFCQKVDQEFPQPRGEKLHVNERLQALADATGIVDQSVLLELDEIGINSNFVGALSLYPLVYVAWADGRIGKRERAAVLQAVETQGHSRGSASYHLLEHWLENPPSQNLFTAWKDYVTAILDTMSSPGAKLTLEDSLMKLVRRVAEASGGILGVHTISDVEEAAMAELERVFDDAPQ